MKQDFDVNISLESLIIPSKQEKTAQKIEESTESIASPKVVDKR